MSQLALEAGYAVPLDAARRNAVEPGEVCGDVQGEAVGSNPTRRELNADGCDLVLPNPHPRVLWMMPALEPIIGERADDDLLQPPQVTVRVAVAQQQNRISDELSGAVKGRIPTPITPKHLCPERTQIPLSRPKIRGASSAAANRVNRWVLEEHSSVGDVIVFAEPHHFFLQLT